MPVSNTPSVGLFLWPGPRRGGLGGGGVRNLGPIAIRGPSIITEFFRNKAQMRVSRPRPVLKGGPSINIFSIVIMPQKSRRD